MSGRETGAAYLVPTGAGESTLVEKRSEFIAHLWPVESEGQARAYIDAMKKQYHDARHNCWCYRLQDGVERYSDDGEPQGTAGQPMLGVLQKEGVTNACCVVTRYFGGILLGAGGLVRAYTQAAKAALDNAGISAVRRWVELSVECPYSYFERVKGEAAALGGVLGETQYAEAVTVLAALPAQNADAFAARMVELSAGTFHAVPLGESFRPVPLTGETQA